MLVSYRIRGGQPPNRGGQLLVDKKEKTAKWHDQDSPGTYQMVSYTKYRDLIRAFESEGAIVITRYYPQNFWEYLKYLFFGDK